MVFELVFSMNINLTLTPGFHENEIKDLYNGENVLIPSYRVVFHFLIKNFRFEIEIHSFKLFISKTTFIICRPNTIISPFIIYSCSYVLFGIISK